MELKRDTLLERGKYRIIETLGQGGFCITYLAEQVMAKRKVCIKEFFPKDYYKRDGDTNNISVASEGFAESMRRFKAKFIKEAQIIASLDHAHIIHIHDVFEENGTAYYVMDYVDGESLSARVKRVGALSERDAVGYIKQIAAALEYIHDRNINHLDVKPGNIMVRRDDNRAILIDFGLSKHYYDTYRLEVIATRIIPVSISPGFTPIELYSCRCISKFSPETDIYSLGATLYFLVTGNVPPLAIDIEEDGIGALPQHISPGIYATIEKSMNFWRKQRPQSIKEFLALLDGKGTVTPNIETTALHIEVADSKTELLPIVEPSKPAPPRQEIQPNNEIWYTSSDGNIVMPSNLGIDIFGAEIVSNTYKDGKGIIKFKDDVTTIGEDAFEWCSNLTSVTIPNSVKTIGEWAFYECKNLTSVTIPNSVTTIGEYAFCYCSSLKEFKSKFASEDRRCFIIDGELIAFAPAGITEYTIPNSVTTIGEGAFYYCSSLKSVTIPNSVTTIGEDAFGYCKNLTSVTIPNSVTTIGEGAFKYCSLTSVTIPNSVKTIGGWVFCECESLTSITIPNSVTTIGDSAFNRCYNLTSVTIPNSVTTIGERAFYECKNLTSVTIPNSVTTIGESAFQDCSNLNSVTIPNSVTTIGWSAFQDCSNLTSVTIPNSVKTIRFAAFENCRNLTSVTITNSVTTIGGSAFFRCESLISITIPNSVTTIGDNAFGDCKSLKEFKGKYAADGGRCLIKDNIIIAYANASGSTYAIPNSVTTIGGAAFFRCESLISITIPNSVTTIGNAAFAHCSNLTSVTIPNSVKTIGDYAFSDCESLTSVTIPNSVTTIGESAFCRCESLTSVSIPNSVTTIGDYAFYHCESLKSVTIPNSVTKIGERTFLGCENLTSVTIPNSVKTIGDYAFRGCNNLSEETKNKIREINPNAL